jgi:4-diphosphocytidyl-2-C-methyl-D-erythritol kinase
VKLLSPAKINLYLHVRQKRKDGFHELDTLFERVGLFDTVTLTARRSGTGVVCRGMGVPGGPANLAYRAAELLRVKYGVTQGVTIRIEKRIPAAAGLGGGSSNAATVLAGLNKLWRLGLGKRELLSLGAEIGSDVPFFLLDTPFAVGRGRGEKLVAVTGKRPKIWHCLVKPPFGISTKEAYGALGPSSLTPHRGNAKLLLHSIKKGDAEGLSVRLVNSLETALNKRVRSITEIKNELLKKGALGALMCGSGSTVFGIFSAEKKARQAARFFGKRQGHQAFAVATF